jgi:tetratricopeptide (TPR) repeat protein
MIVRDERENLEQLLPAIAGAADDLVIVDTGSTDGTADAARRLGAHVVVMPWRDDFAAARNRGLDEVTTSHAAWLDADDRIDRGDLVRLREACLSRPGTAFLTMLVNESSDPAQVTSCWQLRAFPVRPEHRFRGRIHEQIVDALRATGTRVENLDITVRHTGYRDPEEVVRKARRNLELVRREAAETGETATLLHHWLKAAHRCGELEEAARVARRLVEEPPAGTPADVRQGAAATLASVEFQRGNLAAAERVLRESVDRMPDDPIARFLLGDLLARRGDLAGACRELDAARVAPIRQGTLPVPVLGLRRGIRLNLGAVLERLGRFAEAAVAYRELLDDRPEDRHAARCLARTLIAAGVPAEAERILDGLGGEEADAGEVAMLRATVAFNRGEDARAAELFTRAADLLPREPGAPLHLGHLALRAGRVAEARPHYELALRLSDSPETRVGLAACDLESGRLAEALDHLATAVEASAGRPLPRGTEALSGEALLRIGRPREAAEAFEKHLRRHGADPRILARVADCYRALGAREAASLGYRQALELSPDLQEAVSGLRELEAAR